MKTVAVCAIFLFITACQQEQKTIPTKKKLEVQIDAKKKTAKKEETEFASKTEKEQWMKVQSRKLLAETGKSLNEISDEGKVKINKIVADSIDLIQATKDESTQRRIRFDTELQIDKAARETRARLQKANDEADDKVTELGKRVETLTKAELNKK